jgi:hypothetical protein
MSPGATAFTVSPIVSGVSLPDLASRNAVSRASAASAARDQRDPAGQLTPDDARRLVGHVVRRGHG